jgi:hypothetical protein
MMTPTRQHAILNESCMGIGLARYRAPTNLLIMCVTLVGWRLWITSLREGHDAE